MEKYDSDTSECEDHECDELFPIVPVEIFSREYEDNKSSSHETEECTPRIGIDDTSYEERQEESDDKMPLLIISKIIGNHSHEK